MGDAPVVLLTRLEAAAKCRVSLAHFERHVAGHLTPRRIGRRVLYRAHELEAWLDGDEAERPSRTRRAPAGLWPSPASLALLSDPRAVQLTAELRASRERRRLSTGGGTGG